jgi:hypothetical protein
MPLYPSIVLQARERAPILYPSTVFNLGFTFEPFKELGVCHYYFSCCFKYSMLLYDIPYIILSYFSYFNLYPRLL